jgi:hypothetical protein
LQELGSQDFGVCGGEQKLEAPKLTSSWQKPRLSPQSPNPLPKGGVAYRCAVEIYYFSAPTDDLKEGPHYEPPSKPKSDGIMIGAHFPSCELSCPDFLPYESTKSLDRYRPKLRHFTPKLSQLFPKAKTAKSGVGQLNPDQPVIQFLNYKMGRSKKISARIKILKKLKSIKKHRSHARSFFDYYTPWKDQWVQAKTVNIFSEYDRILTSIVNSPDLLIPAQKKSDQLKQCFSKERISSTTIVRVLSWQQKGTSIFDQIINSRTCKPIKNDFESETKNKIENIMIEWGEILEHPFEIVSGCPYASKYFPFVMGTPDITVFSPTWRPLTFLECKDIGSPQAFNTIVGQDPLSGKYFLKKGCQYSKQVQIYLNILLVESGFLLVRFQATTYIFKVYRQPLTSKEMEKIMDFYIRFYLPLTILNRKPKQVEGRIVFLEDNLIIELKKHLFEHFTGMNFDNPDVLENYRPRAWDYDQ